MLASLSWRRRGERQRCGASAHREYGSIIVATLWSHVRSVEKMKALRMEVRDGRLCRFEKSRWAQKLPGR
jgi:hypothetical protein